MRLKQAQLWAVWDIFHLVHALPLDPESWNYITSLREAEENFPHFITPVCLVGHSHRPFIVEQPNNQKAVFNPEQSVILADDCRYIINVGSVGQPRDGDPRACYIIYDSESRNIRFKRIKYDVLAAQEKMRRAQMPEFLVERLSTGR